MAGNTGGMPKQSSDAGSIRPAVLVTRPAAASARFASTLADRFGDRVEPILSPLMQPVFHQPALPQQRFDAVVFTSEAGVEGARHLMASGVSLPTRAFCVGNLTAKVAATHGFEAQSAEGDASALVAMILRSAVGGPLLYLHGRDTRGDLAEQLNSAGIVTHSALVYQQDPFPLSPLAVSRLAQPGPVLVPLFSPRSADLFCAALPASMAPLYLAAMSAAVATQADPIPHHALRVAARPDGDAMLDTLEDLLILAQAP
jgi:uroporphyrinogen-III synthase